MPGPTVVTSLDCLPSSSAHAPSPRPPSFHHHRTTRQARGYSARVPPVWARVGGVTPRTPIPECVDGDIADGHQSAAAVVVVFHAFHHTRNAVHSDRVS